MFNLIWYLIVVLILFGFNFGLLLNAKKIKSKIPVYIVIYSFSIFLLSFLVSFIKLDFLINYVEYLFFFTGLFILLLILYQFNKKNKKLNTLTFFGLILISYIIIGCLLLSVSSLSFNFSVLIFFIFILFSFLGFKLSKNSDFNGKMSEYLILESILLMIFGLTYPYVITLNYLDFLPFTILAPTYEIVLLIIFIFALLVVGVFLNDYGKK